MEKYIYLILAIFVLILFGIIHNTMIQNVETTKTIIVREPTQYYSTIGYIPNLPYNPPRYNLPRYNRPHYNRLRYNRPHHNNPHH